MIKRKALGKGLSALIPEANPLPEGEEGFFQCPIEMIEPSPFQPRKNFGEADLEALADSVREKGIITPLLVSKSDEGYRLIAGERRWRAAQRAGIKRVPVVIRETSAKEALELALIENIHRKDLNPIEEALAYRRWLDDAETTQEELAKNIGKDRSTITNTLRLLNLPRNIQQDLIDELLTMGHARILAGIKNSSDQKKLRDLIINKALSVRQVELLMKKERKRDPLKRKKSVEADYYFQSMADDLKRSLGTKVDIKKKGVGGSIVIHFFSDDELGRLLELLT